MVDIQTISFAGVAGKEKKVGDSMWVKSPFPSDDSRMLGQHEETWVGPEPGNDDEALWVSAQVQVSDCEQLATAWIKNNRVQAVDVLGLSVLAELLKTSMHDLTDDELNMFDTCVRAEQYRRGK